jgi:hypothetical protein
MVTDTPVDSYTLILEFSEDASRERVRAVATNRRDQSAAATWMSFEQTRSLFGHAYGGEKTIIDEYLEQLRENHVIELLAAAGSPCIFSPKELVQYGFSPDELEP